MATDKIRKYVLPNIPYLFIGWFCLKIGTAYRLAAGTGFGEKLLGLGQTIGAAFASFAPGLAPLDWFVGIVGAVGFRLLIYCKAKKAKKFRRDAEYGTARWGNEKDIKPFVDPKFENNMLLTATERLTMNTRPKNPANARNLNFCGIGSSGSGKTRFWLTPQLLQAHSSYVVVDPKGGVLGQVGAFLQHRGYQIKVFNSIDFSKSMHYNPLSYIRNEADILKFVNALITNTKGEGKEGDPFWTKAETLLYCALIAYIIFEGPAEDRNMNTLVDMISGMEVKEDDENYKNAVDYMFDGLAKRKPDCFAVKQYRKFKLSSGKTAKSMGILTEWITEWLKGLLIEGIMGNLEGLFDTVNTRVGEISVQVGTTPAAWNAGVFSLIRQLSETVILPIAGLILTFVATYELIQMILEKNNMHEFDVANIYKWVFKTTCAILILSNTFNIVMAVFDVSQSVIASAAGIVTGATNITPDMLANLEMTLETMELGPLLGLFLQSFLIKFTMLALNIFIFVIVYGRMIEIYLLTSLAPIPVATLSNRELGTMGQNYLRSLFAVGFQGMLILVCVAIYAVLIQGIATSGDPIGAIWGCIGYTVLLCFMLMKTGTISKSIFSAH